LVATEEKRLVMFVHKRHGWEIPERFVTPGVLVLGRWAAMARVAGIAATGIVGPARGEPDPRCAARRDITAETDATTRNNGDEFGTSQRMPTQAGNGYGAFVANMYSDKKNERLFV
jgi:hypothetical protein